MATLRHVLNGLTLQVEIPVSYQRANIANDQVMVSGNTRRYLRATKRRCTLRVPNLSEAVLAALEVAATAASAIAHTDERNTTRQVLVDDFRYTLARARPDNPDAPLATQTGATFYDVEIDLREV